MARVHDIRDDAFARAVGAGRGARDVRGIGAPSPSSSAKAAARSLLDDVACGELDEALALLSGRGDRRDAPLLGELHRGVSAYLSAEAQAAWAASGRLVLSAAMLRNSNCEHVVCTSVRDEEGVRERLHLVENGLQFRLAGHLTGLRKPTAVCGAELHTAWRSWRGKWGGIVKGGNSGDWRVCEACAGSPAAVSFADELAEDRDRWLLFGGPHKRAFERRAARAVSRQLAKLLSRAEVSVEDARTTAQSAVRAAMVTQAAHLALERGEALLLDLLESGRQANGVDETPPGAAALSTQNWPIHRQLREAWAPVAGVRSHEVRLAPLVELADWRRALNAAAPLRPWPAENEDSSDPVAFFDRLDHSGAKRRLVGVPLTVELVRVFERRFAEAGATWPAR